MKELKPFDLEAAKRGDPICFEDGELLHFIGVAVSGLVVAQRKHGGMSLEFGFSELRMAPKKITVYLNIRANGVASWYATDNLAKDVASVGDFLAIAAPVEIEE